MNKVRLQLTEKYAPFDMLDFYDQHIDLVHKFLRKKTDELEVLDQGEDGSLPEEWQYKNNANVIKAKTSRDYTVMQKLEWIKCSLNAVYFAKKYVRITSIDEGIIPFRMYEYQEDMIQLFQDNRLCIACTGRQQGKTTTSAAYILWFTMFHPTKEAAILANKADQAQEIMERIQMSYELLPIFLKLGMKTYNKRSMKFDNDSKSFSAASSASAIRGRSISLLYWDEAAHTPNDIEFYESIFPTLSSGKKSKMIMTSTPNGTRGLFYKIWEEHNQNGFARIRVTWDQIPSRDAAWAEAMIAASSEAQFRQEHCAEFRGSSNSLLSGSTLERLVTKAPIEERDGFRVYKEVEKHHEYFITVDVSRGVGGDYHAFSVIDLSLKPYEVVATYRNNHLDPLVYPTLIYNVATHYNMASVLIEINDIGEQVANNLYYDLEYENLLMVTREKNRQVLGFGGNPRVGVRTDKAVKAIGCSNIKTMIEKEQIILNDADMINEFGTFVPKGGSYEADKGAHDDMVMTLVLFAWASMQTYFIDLTNRDLRVALLQQMEDRSMEEVSPFGFIDNDQFGSFGGDVMGGDVFGGF